MSSDGYFDDDPLDFSALDQIDAVAAAHFNTAKPLVEVSRTTTKVSHPQSPPIEIFDGESFDATFDVDESELARLDGFIEDAYRGKAGPVPGPSTARPLPRTSSKNAQQMTLFGEPLQDSGDAPAGRSTRPPRNPFGQQARKTKTWDHTEFAKSGWRQSKAAKAKGKARSNGYNDEEEEEPEERVEFEQFPAPEVIGWPVTFRPTLPMKLRPDLLEAKHWIYPLNKDKRDYQFNIVSRCLFDNTLVALPTGLGKTFIAGVVMLNFYRWYPEGKIVFVAPTKPLVAQQIEACHQVCGIPGSDAVELTGQVQKAARAASWFEKRVFYMTPQTLINDLVSENIDSRDIVLLVIDEAHKGTGDYAYPQVIRYLMAKNPYHRVLALTATPGNKPDAVQAIIDGLHISRIEIRDESSMDLKPYMFEKVLKLHVIAMHGDVVKLKDLLLAVMENVAKNLKSRGIFPPHTNVFTMHPYRTTAISNEIYGRKQNDKMWATKDLALLGSLCRSMAYLYEGGSIAMAHNTLRELAVRPTEGEGKKKNAALDRLLYSAQWIELMQEFDLTKARGYPSHPKVEKLVSLLLQHFAENESEEGGTRAIVFVSFRDAVEEVVAELDKHKPMITASRFVGQASGKDGKKGFAQREQIDVVKQFREGKINVLVSTAIGEEGLDIGNVDFILCYDASKSPIRMLQRVGRTGRKRTGHVHVLLAEQREEQNWDKAQASYNDVQKSIVRGEDLELYRDVPRLLPDHIKPQCIEKVMEIQEYIREDPKRRGSKLARANGGASAGRKRKRNDDAERNMPAGTSTGFVSVKDLIVKGQSKKRKKNYEFDPTAGEDDEEDRMLEENDILGLKRSHSTADAVISTLTRHKKPRRTATEGGSSAKRKQPVKKAKVIEPLSLSQFSQKGHDDSDDLLLEHGGPMVASPARSTSGSRSASISDDGAVVDLVSDSCLEDIELDPPLHSEVDRSPVASRKGKTVHQNGDLSVVDLASQSPPRDDASTRMPPALSPAAARADRNMAWLVDDDEEPSLVILSSPLVDRELHSSPNKDRVPRHALSPPAARVASGSRTGIMGPPTVPTHRTSSSPHPTLPEPSHPIRPPAARQRRAPVGLDSPIASPPRRRLQKNPEPSSPDPIQIRSHRRKRGKDPQNRFNPWLQMEADHSGEEVSEGSSHPEDDVESESDIRFLQELSETQASPTYNQTLAYRQSLLTQAPNAPAFADGPVRRGRFGPNRAIERNRVEVSSSPSRVAESPDEYSFGSFLVPDDEVVYSD